MIKRFESCAKAGDDRAWDAWFKDSGKTKVASWRALFCQKFLTLPSRVEIFPKSPCAKGLPGTAWHRGLCPLDRAWRVN